MAQLTRCPKCGSSSISPVSERQGGVSAKKALIGTVIAGPVGLAAGALGKKKVLYQCSSCSYMIEK